MLVNNIIIGIKNNDKDSYNKFKAIVINVIKDKEIYNIQLSYEDIIQELAMALISDKRDILTHAKTSEINLAYFKQWIIWGYYDILKRDLAKEVEYANNIFDTILESINSDSKMDYENVVDFIYLKAGYAKLNETEKNIYGEEICNKLKEFVKGLKPLELEVFCAHLEYKKPEEIDISRDYFYVLVSRIKNKLKKFIGDVDIVLLVENQALRGCYISDYCQ